MKQNKLVIVVLVVIVVLFAVGLTMGLFHGEEENENGMTMRQAQKEKKGWVATLQEWMSPFDSKLDPGRLIALNNCKIDKSTNRLTLTKNKPVCNFKIAEQDGDSVQKAVLSVKTGNVKLQASYPEGKACATTARGTRVSLNKFNQPRAKFGMTKIKPGVVVQGGVVTSPKLLTLDVIYKPAGSHEKTKQCEVKGDNIDLAVLENGGTLNLICTGCKEKNRSIVVALE